MSNLLYGSLLNRMMEQTAKLPQVGDAATVCAYTDRYAGTVISVDEKRQSFTVQRDKATRTDSFGMSESQEYAYEPNPNGITYTFKRCRKGSRLEGRFRENGKMNGNGVRIGVRDEHYDFSF